MITIKDLIKEVHEIAKFKGWWESPRETGTLLMLMVSELAEAMEADRKGDEENFKEELADTVIRIFDYCGAKNIDLEDAILKKIEVNKGREFKHGGKKY